MNDIPETRHAPYIWYLWGFFYSPQTGVKSFSYTKDLSFIWFNLQCCIQYTWSWTGSEIKESFVLRSDPRNVVFITHHCWNYASETMVNIIRAPEYRSAQHVRRWRIVLLCRFFLGGGRGSKSYRLQICSTCPWRGGWVHNTESLAVDNYT